MNALSQRIKEDGPILCEKIDAVFLFEINERKGGNLRKWTVDLKNKPGFCKEGEHGDFDCTMVMSDIDFINIANKTANPQMIFMLGNMKIKGTLAKALKFTPDLFPPPLDLTDLFPENKTH